MRHLGIPSDYSMALIQGSLMDYFTKSKTHRPPSLLSHVWVDEITGEIVPSFEALFIEVVALRGVWAYLLIIRWL